jgi:hypothetical protein
LGAPVEKLPDCLIYGQQSAAFFLRAPIEKLPVWLIYGQQSAAFFFWVTA